MILSTIALSALLGLATAQTGTYAPPSTPDPSSEICPQFQFNAESRIDCSRTTCLAPLNSTRNCLQYCEVRRSGFVGPVGIPQTSWNGTTNAWEATDLPVGPGGDGELLEVTTGIHQTSWMEIVPGMQAMRESVGYEFSTAPTLKARTRKVAREDHGMSENTKKLLQEQGYKVRWVYFPLLIETCGTMRERKFNATARGEGKCYGDLRETENRCVTGAWTSNGEAVVGWAQRYEHANGSTEGIDQPESYQSLSRGLYRPVAVASGAERLRTAGILVGVWGFLAAFAI